MTTQPDSFGDQSAAAAQAAGVVEDLGADGLQATAIDTEPTRTELRVFLARFEKLLTRHIVSQLRYKSRTAFEKDTLQRDRELLPEAASDFVSKAPGAVSAFAVKIAKPERRGEVVTRAKQAYYAIDARGEIIAVFDHGYDNKYHRLILSDDGTATIVRAEGMKQTPIPLAEFQEIIEEQFELEREPIVQEAELVDKSLLGVVKRAVKRAFLGLQKKFSNDKQD